MEPLREVLRSQPLCDGFREEDLACLAERLNPLDLPPGAVIFRRGEPIAKVYLLVSGRTRLIAPTVDGSAAAELDSSPGDLLGALALIESGVSMGDMTATEPVRLLAMDREAFLEAFDHIPRMGFNLLRRLTRITKQIVGMERQEILAATWGVIWKGPRGRRLLDILTRELSGRGERVATAAPADLNGAERWTQLLRAHDRVLLEIDLDQPSPESLAGADRCDRILWLVDSLSEPALRQTLRRLTGESPGAAERMEVAWMLPEGTAVAPPWDRAWDLGRRHLIVEVPDHPGSPGRAARMGIDRLVRRMRGITLGLALAGGGARGLAHLGVFRALERAGIGFDVMSGTSCGAMVGITYAAGYTPEFAIAAFKRDLALSRIFRLLPRGPTWYIFLKYRSRAWEGILRRHFQDWTLERLPIPFHAVTVDLVRGREVVRCSGEAVGAILESINLPVISRPIIREGMALVDGGVLNNLPADVLAREGADLVVGVDVSSKLRDEFAGIGPAISAPPRRSPGTLETLIRVLETQARGLGFLRARSMDLTIQPDASSFSFVDFTKAPELADVGEAAADRALPRLKQLIAETEARVVARRTAAAALPSPRPSGKT